MELCGEKQGSHSDVYRVGHRHYHRVNLLGKTGKLLSKRFILSTSQIGMYANMVCNPDAGASYQVLLIQNVRSTAQKHQKRSVYWDRIKETSG